MGCTHYPFVIPLIQTITGPSVRIIDPAPAIARQTQRLLKQSDMINNTNDGGNITFYSSAEASHMARLLPLFIGEDGLVLPVRWSQGSTKEILPH
jgi:glutamate racemase